MTVDQHAIVLDNLGLRRRDRWILRNLSWRVRQGTCAAILGPNGSGKSTLARILACHLWPTEGDCTILGQRFGEADLPALRQSIRLLQPAGPYDIDSELTAREVVTTGYFGTLALYETPTESMLAEADRMLAQVGLASVADHTYATLSNGERLRSLVARALIQKPRLLLLDEPTAGLDLLAREQILATVQALFDNNGNPPTVILITHHVEELPPATSQVLVLSNGQPITAGPPSEVFTPEILSQAYNCPVHVRHSNGRFYLEVNPTAWTNLIRNNHHQ
ncbi:MAG: ABC transporter ATP-binding protein [Bacillota bacterium]